MLVKTEPISLVSATSEETAAVRRVLSERYGIVAADVSRYAEKTTSAVFRCETDGGEAVVVKRSGWTDDIVAVSRSCGLSERLRALGVALPRVFETSGGDFVAKDGKDMYQVLSHLPGEHSSSSLEEWASAGAALGKFHAAGLRILRENPSEAEAIARDIPVQMSYEESRAMYLSGLRETLLATHDCAFPGVCAAFRENVDLLDRTMERVDAAKASVHPTVGVVHNDFHVNNGLYLEDGSFSGFLDMDQAGVGPLVWDVGNSIFSFASNALGSVGPERLPELVAAFLSGYGRERRLSVEEYLLIVPAGLRWDLMRILRSLRRHRFENDRFPGNIRKIKDRLIERVRRFPEILGFVDDAWIAAVMSRRSSEVS